MTFNYDDTIAFLEDFDKFKDSKAERLLKNLLQNDGFKEWLFNSSQKFENLNQAASKLYEEITKPRILKTISAMIEEEGYDQFDRTNAAFLTSIVNIAVKANNDRLTEISKLRKDNQLTEKSAEQLREKLIKNNDIILRLQKCARKIVKRKAKKIEEDVGLPRELIIIALYSVPDAKYIDRFKVGFYLNNFLNALYTELDKPEYATANLSMKDVDWEALFKETYGKNNVIEAATFILLEGMRRIDPFKSQVVRQCWDSLTVFALKELEDAPDSLREQMMDLYIKRIDKMFANHSFDLRVDMRQIDSLIFPNLAKTLDRYKDKITEIVKRDKE
jgi:hypothetical protein